MMKERRGWVRVDSTGVGPQSVVVMWTGCDTRRSLRMSTMFADPILLYAEKSPRLRRVSQRFT